jgi:NAD(P)-dependent dehydrogenase (short-subunit alcohol dehydrogenase family)
MRDNVVIVTGASKGIGAELARRLASHGASVALAARDGPALERVAAACREYGGNAVAIPCDVTVEADCRRLVEATVAAFGRIDTLVNNAGATMYLRFDEVRDPALFARLMEVNYLGAVYCTFHALPHLKASRGRLVGVASLTALTGVPTRSGYAASKHAMRGFFDSLRIELAETGVTVTMIYPGFVATGIRAAALGRDGRPVPVDPHDAGDVMTVEECARLTQRAIEDRRRELVMTARGKLGMWAKLVAPGLVDRMAQRVIAKRHPDAAE